MTPRRAFCLPRRSEAAREASRKPPRELETSLKLEDSADAHLSLAHVYLSMNQTELARAQGQAALNLEPGNPQAVQLMQQIHGWRPVAPRKTP